MSNKYAIERTPQNFKEVNEWAHKRHPFSLHDNDGIIVWSDSDGINVYSTLPEDCIPCPTFEDFKAKVEAAEKPEEKKTDIDLVFENSNLQQTISLQSTLLDAYREAMTYNAPSYSPDHNYWKQLSKITELETELKKQSL